MKPLTKSKQIFQLQIPTPFPVGDVNVYLIKGDSLTLIDAGPKTDRAWYSFLQQLKEIGYRPQDIDQIVITHHHPDHVGLLDYFEDHIPILGHSFNRPWLAKDKEFMANLSVFYKKSFVQFGVNKALLSNTKEIEDTFYQFSCQREMNYYIREGEEVLPDWKVFETPGHAQSHIVLYNEREEVLIGGDLLLKHISPNPLLEPPMKGYRNERPRPLLQLNQSISKLLTLPISLVYTGHGEHIEDAHPLIQDRLNQQAERAEFVRQLLKKRPLTAFQVCQALFPAIYHKQLMFTMSETVGQLDYLEEMGHIKVDTVEDKYIYLANEQ